MSPRSSRAEARLARPKRPAQCLACAHQVGGGYRKARIGPTGDRSLPVFRGAEGRPGPAGQNHVRGHREAVAVSELGRSCAPRRSRAARWPAPPFRPGSGAVGPYRSSPPRTARRRSQTGARPASRWTRTRQGAGGRRRAEHARRMPDRSIAATAGAGSVAASSLRISAPMRSFDRVSRPAGMGGTGGQSLGVEAPGRVAIAGVKPEEPQDAQIILGIRAADRRQTARRRATKVGKAAQRVNHFARRGRRKARSS